MQISINLFYIGLVFLVFCYFLANSGASSSLRHVCDAILIHFSIILVCVRRAHIKMDFCHSTDHLNPQTARKALHSFGGIPSRFRYGLSKLECSKIGSKSKTRYPYNEQCAGYRSLKRIHQFSWRHPTKAAIFIYIFLWKPETVEKPGGSIYTHSEVLGQNRRYAQLYIAFM